MKRLTAALCLTTAELLGSAGAGSALPYCPSDRNQNYHNCYGTYTSASGARYVGEFRNDKRHGQGTYTTVTGGKYVGNFWDGRENGQDTFTFANGRMLEGIWKDGKFQYAQKVAPRP